MSVKFHRTPHHCIVALSLSPSLCVSAESLFLDKGMQTQAVSPMHLNKIKVQLGTLMARKQECATTNTGGDSTTQLYSEQWISKKLFCLLPGHIFSHVMKHNSGLMLMNQEANCVACVRRWDGDGSVWGCLALTHKSRLLNFQDFASFLLYTIVIKN